MKKKTKVMNPNPSFEVGDIVTYTTWDDGRGNPSSSTQVGRILMIEGGQLVVRTQVGLDIWVATSTKKLEI